MPAKSLSLAFAASALAALSVSGGAAARAQDCDGTPSSAKLIVQVDGVQSGNGKVTLTLYPDDPAKFLAPHGSLKVVRAPAKSPTTYSCFYLPGPGGYAVAVYHDENGNGKFDRKGILPAEGSGLSDNPNVGLFHLPTLSGSRFVTHVGENHIEIRLRYPR